MNISDYNQCVDKHADGVYRFILKHLRVEDRARDVVQDAFLKMWEKHKDIDSQKSKSYLYTTAYHCMIDVLRREKRVEYRDEIPRNFSSQEMAPPDFQHLLSLALDKLPEIQKTVVLLRDLEGYNYDEIGEICGLNPSQVKVYIYRARLSMKSFIGRVEVMI